ncbi:RNA-binding protein [Candidatus Uhrbacteria bacterium]|nr:RNA-binding protein [Candidatus Uhrbacteria bacterium]MBD3283850.1 RNA-binding protein [Candidatus Uhrbacteria bacterium]
MPKKLFVGGLPWAVTDQDLAELFAQVGTVDSARVITDRMTGRSRGFGFVEMSTDEEAQKAIDTLHESDVEGRTINVRIAEERAPDSRPPRRDNRY